MKGTVTKGRVVYDRETKTATTKTFLWDNPELRKAFADANKRERERRK